MLVVEIASTGLIFTARPVTAEFPVASTTLTEKENVPDAVGVPLSEPPPLRGHSGRQSPCVEQRHDNTPEPPVAVSPTVG